MSVSEGRGQRVRCDVGRVWSWAVSETAGKGSQRGPDGEAGPGLGEVRSRELDRAQVSEDQVQAVAEGMVGDKVTAGEVVGVPRSGGGASLPCVS